jgi:hypothetical protein
MLVHELLSQFRQILAARDKFLLQQIPRALHHHEIGDAGSQFLRGKWLHDVIVCPAAMDFNIAPDELALSRPANEVSLEFLRLF